MSAVQTSPQAVDDPSPMSDAPAASTLPPAGTTSSPNNPTPGADFDLDDALRKALPDHGTVDWDDVAERVLAAIPNKAWRKVVLPMAREWCRLQIRKSRGNRGSLWSPREDAAAPSEPNGNGKPWFAQPSVQDSIQHKLDAMWAGEHGTKRLHEFTAKDVATAKARAESTVRTGLLRVKGFDALLKAMNEHGPKTVGDLPRNVLEQVVPPLFVSAPMREDDAA